MTLAPGTPPSTRTLPRKRVVPVPDKASPSSKRMRVLPRGETDPSKSVARRVLRPRIDHSERIWAGRCGCRHAQCMADSHVFSDDEEQEDLEEAEYEDDISELDQDREAGRAAAMRAQKDERWGSRPAEPGGSDPDPSSDMVPMLLHLLLIM